MSPRTSGSTVGAPSQGAHASPLQGERGLSPSSAPTSVTQHNTTQGGTVHRAFRLPTRIIAYLDTYPAGERTRVVVEALEAHASKRRTPVEQKRQQREHLVKQRARLDAEIHLIETDLRQFDEQATGRDQDEERLRARVEAFLSKGPHTKAQEQQWAKTVRVPWDRFLAIKAEVQRA